MHALNTLKEISELKNEIVKLTTSLRKIKPSPLRDREVQVDESDDDCEKSVEQSWWRA
jgi:hypothetical protein